MAWRVDRFNEVRNETQTAAQVFATGVEAFDAALDNLGTFIKDVIRNPGFGDDTTPPGNDAAEGRGHRVKVWVEYRTDKPHLGVEMRYDYPTGTPPNNPEGTWATNSIHWRIRQE